MFRNIISSEIGAIHLVAAVLAMVCGAFVLLKQKGTALHRRAGYSYLFFMVLLNSSAFLIYRLFGKFGIFHVLAIVSFLTLAAGMIPLLIKKPANNWANLHFNFMYWSVVGLYAAFAAEVLVRVPKTPFFGMVGVATAVIMILGCVGFFLNKKRWEKIAGTFENRERRELPNDVREAV